jgi:acetamidase/formamidase
MPTHRLDAGPNTVHWGFFDSALKPLITVDPGDTVVISTVSGPESAMPAPGSGLTVPAALPAIHAKLSPKLGGPHMMTGPVEVRGARRSSSTTTGATIT